jgi:hypothetical protein
VAAVSGPVIRQDRDHAMKKANNPLTPVAKQPGREHVHINEAGRPSSEM